MWIRILKLVLILGLLGFGIWFLFRTTPPRQVQQLRAKIQKLVFSDDPEDWEAATTSNERGGKNLSALSLRLELARMANDSILKLFPESREDMMMRAQLEEIAGKQIEALKWYDRILSSKNPPLEAELRRGNVNVKLGRYTAAKQSYFSVADAFPFPVSLRLGRLSLETFEPQEAYNHFKRARSLAKTDGELRDSLEGIEEALRLLLALPDLPAPPSPEVSPAEVPAEDAILEARKKERREVLEESMTLWKRISPQSRVEFVATRLKIAELLSKSEYPSPSEESLKFLKAAVEADEENRFVPIYLQLGGLCCKLGYERSIEENQKRDYLKSAEEYFLRAFSFDPPNTAKHIARQTGWDVPDSTTKESFQGLVLMRACSSLVAYPEHWRLLSDQDVSGGMDSLKIQSRLREALGSQTLQESIRLELKVLQAIAMLKSNLPGAFQKEVAEIFSSASEPDVPLLALRLAEGSALAAPGFLEVSLELLEKRLLEREEVDGIDKERKFLDRLAAVKILHHARKLPPPGPANDPAKRKFKGEEEFITGKMRAILLKLAQDVERPDHYLAVSRWMGSLVSPREGFELLARGRERFPEDYSIRQSLGWAHLLKGLSLEASKSAVTDEKPAWDHYSASLMEILPLFKRYPYREELQVQLFLIGARLKKVPEGLLDWKAIARAAFPDIVEKDAEILVENLKLFLKQEFKTTVERASVAADAVTVRSFLKYLIGSCSLQLALTSLPEEKERLLKRARQEYEEGLALDASSMPLKLGLSMVDLNLLSHGQKVPEPLKQALQELVDQAPAVPQFHYLRGLVLKKQRESQIAGGEALQAVLRTLVEERKSYRKAIYWHPQFTKAYLAWAETYAPGWEPSTNGQLGESKNLPKPDFARAFSILEFAPRGLEVQNMIASYYQVAGELEKSLRSYEELFKMKPDEMTAKRVIHAYTLKGDFQGARNWLARLDGTPLTGEQKDLIKNALLAEVAAAEARAAPEISPSDRARLEEEQIQHFRAILSQARASGKEPHAFAVNNLSYLLAERGKPNDIQEALSILEPVITSLREKKSILPRDTLTAVEETYAWVLFKNHQLDQAEKIYRRIGDQLKNPEVQLHFAMVLHELKQYREARQKLELAMNSKLPPDLQEKARQLKIELDLLLKE